MPDTPLGLTGIVYAIVPRSIVVQYALAIIHCHILPVTESLCSSKKVYIPV